ncbi:MULTISPECIES: hypothetical protein [Xanthomonas]|uniref:Uncharacterized protein n=2 Tax=Xanthomonas TaxID=338 RepID=A0AB73H3P2_9XANT|nr:MULTISPECIES: hypothetical protein [Xanthomonas]MBB5672288.1 hypothetical protein [Xanthomonas arboricola]MCC8577748.1 hypothetical protein [Xanthomonas euvesicatoria pv. euvesicatoria]MCC8588195.1 hypothetical protein [Xanthomonas euvesicatoria pv. euvesicatoria]MCC8637183.1 hypothetical protein [Xanthomonas euvesicatoria pv. euvesicatoria]MCC8641446.1 hypothetical protein [Xanthomonas euvesicatoria pv. euvesicatoria]
MPTAGLERGTEHPQRARATESSPNSITPPLKPVTAIYIDTGLVYRLVEAVVSTPFGIHRGADGHSYCLSHIATGYRIGSGFASLDQVLALCEDLRRMKITWDFTEKAVIAGWSYYARNKILSLITKHGGTTGSTTR